MNLHLSDDVLPLTLRAAAPLSDDDLMRLSEENKPYRLERTAQGEITVMTPVGGIGGTHEFYVASQLFNWIDSSGTGIGFGPNTGFNLPDGSCLAPDAAWLSLSRWQALSPKQKEGYPPLCPEFIIEIRSRSDSRRLLETKMQLWLSNGAELAWLIDPIDSTITIYSASASDQVLTRPATISGAGPVTGFELNSSRLWTSV